MNKTINVIRATVIVRSRFADVINLELEGSSTFPSQGYPLTATIGAAHEFGAAWVRENIGIEPEVINLG